MTETELPPLIFAAKPALASWRTLQARGSVDERTVLENECARILGSPTETQRIVAGSFGGRIIGDTWIAEFRISTRPSGRAAWTVTGVTERRR